MTLQPCHLSSVVGPWSLSPATPSHAASPTAHRPSSIHHPPARFDVLYLLLLLLLNGLDRPRNSKPSNMSFGWSLGDIFAGIKILWSIYDAVSDGPLNATLQCEQFFEEFSLVVQCLEDWERKAQIVQDDSLVKLHVQLQQQCEVFILRHFNLIQAVNPESKAIRDRQSTWLKKVSFSREQVSRLYQQARWPFENKEVARLRKKLMLFLALATYHVSSSTHNVTVENRDILLDIRCVLSTFSCIAVLTSSLLEHPTWRLLAKILIWSL